MMITRDDKHTFIFGCGDLGRIAKDVFEYYDIEVFGYLSSVVPDNKQFQGKQVYTPYEISDQKDNSRIAICIFDDENESIIRDKLENLGFRYFYDKEEIINDYLKKNIKPIGFTVNGDGITVNKITVNITEKCSLKCKYCGQFTPYIKAPIHYKKERIIQSFLRFERVVNSIEYVSFIGGEALLHPNVAEILKCLCESKKTKKIDITTNGTIVPQDDFWNVLREYQDKIKILVSDYSNYLSTNKRFFDKAMQYGVQASLYKTDYTTENGKWLKNRLPKNYGRTRKQNRNLYVTCQAMEQCPTFRDGRLYHCQTASIGERLNRIPFAKEDSIDFLDESISDEQLKKKLTNYLLSATPPLACGFCYSGELESIPMGEQIKESTWSINDLENEEQQKK